MTPIRTLALLAALAAGCATTSVLAQPSEGRMPPGQAKKQDQREHPGGKGEGKHEGKGEKKRAEAPRGPAVEPPRPGAVFTPAHNDAVRGWYAQQYTRNCPPGLAKKNNGCLPPGQAKKLSVGERLPRDVIYYPVPQPAVVLLPAVPPGYRYVRVGDDIVLLSPQTSLIVDIIHAVLH